MTAVQAVFRDDDYYGATVNRCARLRAVAWGGQTLMTSAAADVLRDHVPDGASLVDRGSHRLRDLHAPVHIWELVDLDHPREFPPIGSLSRVRHNLPQETTSFLGRDDDVGQVREALATARLVSICGTAGLGKTRLSLRVAAELLDVHAHGAGSSTSPTCAGCRTPRRVSGAGATVTSRCRPGPAAESR